MPLTNKQLATAGGAVLIALAGVLSQCPDEPPPAPPAVLAPPPSPARAIDAGQR